MKVLIPQDITPPGKEYLIQKGYEVMVGSGVDEDTVCREIQDCDALLIRISKVTRKIMESSKNLKVIGRHGVGVDNIDLKAAADLGIQVTYGPLSNFDSVAEHAVALILASGHRVIEMDRHVRENRWEMRNKVKLMETTNKTLGVIGLGRIGSSTARKCALGLSMKVVGYDVFMDKMELPDYIQPAASLDEIFQTSDYVSLHIPTTPETRNSINKKYFDMMRESAYLINCARGEVVNEADLYQALSTGRIRGAALDVLQNEPPSMDDPLLTLDNLILSPHCGAHTEGTVDTMGLHAAQGIHEVLSGGTPTWPVPPVQT